MAMQSAVPTGLKILPSGPTDKSVGYFHLSLRDKMHIYKKMGMNPIEQQAGSLRYYSHFDGRGDSFNSGMEA